AEIGTAFKAPSFSELFLNFEGATYRVIGANSIEFYLDDLEINGQLQDRYFSDHKEIRAEQSFSHLYNLSLQINDKTRFTAAYTANHIANYIELVPVALNNKSYRIYSYRNISGLRSRTATLSLSWNPIPSMHLNGAYIYTRAEDESVLEAIQKRSILNNIGKPVQAADYGGLFDRSIHQFKLTARFQSDFGFSSMLNLHYRGPFGTIENDADGNGILNLKSEYEDAFVTIDLNLRQALNSHLSTQLRIANLGDFRSTSQKLYGRKIQFGINYTY
ncbi:MAG: TonB-dependent receptor, partial [Calditrichaeota bacterium]|nr:TonB-dependent receptor [Calditrichota bacterium]